MKLHKSLAGHLLLTVCELGSAPSLPGTLASAVTAVGVLLSDRIFDVHWELRAAVFFGIACMLTIAGVAVLGGPRVRTTDDSRIVLDEVVGMLIAASTAHGLSGVFVAFLLFRFFDIVKPFGIRSIDRRGTAASIFLDDIVAGLASAAVLMIV